MVAVVAVATASEVRPRPVATVALDRPRPVVIGAEVVIAPHAQLEMAVKKGLLWEISIIITLTYITIDLHI